MRTNTVDRFWSKVTRTDDCWLWQGYVDRDGYGTFPVNRAPVRAHRFAYEQTVGQIPAGLVIDHLCRTRNCVRPDHLEPVTERENVMRSNGIAALNAAKTQCLAGHEFTAKNTYITGRGSRQCRACVVTRSAKHRARRRNQEGASA